jgi:hypothetical protein
MIEITDILETLGDIWYYDILYLSYTWKPFPVRSSNLRARPERTQLEHLSDASFLGKLLVLPANVRLDWKVIARYKHSSLFGLTISNEGKKFYNTGTRCQFQKQFTSNLQLQQNRLVCHLKTLSITQPACNVWTVQLILLEP